uniref:Uncharacterized protein n=1 Tax=Sphaerodactylus townsendi TaxID=933632 RepID=A0ACB8F6E9_9SAUR
MRGCCRHFLLLLFRSLPTVTVASVLVWVHQRISHGQKGSLLMETSLFPSLAPEFLEDREPPRNIKRREHSPLFADVL